MCSAERENGYRLQCALQRGGEATNSNVLCREGEWLQTAMCSAYRKWSYRQQCALQRGSVATDRKWSYRQEVWLQTAMCSTDRKCGDSQATWFECKTTVGLPTGVAVSNSGLLVQAVDLQHLLIGGFGFQVLNFLCRLLECLHISQTFTHITCTNQGT